VAQIRPEDELAVALAAVDTSRRWSVFEVVGKWTIVEKVRIADRVVDYTDLSGGEKLKTKD
jgi:hypothetical protein